MFDIVIAVGMFVISVVSHIAIHRMLLRFGKRSFISAGTFCIGIVVTSLVVTFYHERLILFWGISLPVWTIRLPVTAIVLNVFLAIFYLIYVMSPYLGDEGPTAKILAALESHPGGLTKRQIAQGLSDREILVKRIGDLQRSQWIRERKNHYQVTARGESIARTIFWYRGVLKIVKAG